MKMPGFGAETSLHKTSDPYYLADGHGQAIRSIHPAASAKLGSEKSLPCTYGPCLPYVNCVDHGGGVYDCWVVYERMQCCSYPSFGPALGALSGGTFCIWTRWGCPPGHNI